MIISTVGIVRAPTVHYNTLPCAFTRDGARILSVILPAWRGKHESFDDKVEILLAVCQALSEVHAMGAVTQLCLDDLGAAGEGGGSALAIVVKSL